MPELEDQLTALGASIAWPPTPEFLLPIYGEVAAKPAEGPRSVRRIPRWALAAAALLLIVAAVAFTWLGLHTAIYRVPSLPTPTPHSPGVLGSNLGLGAPTTLSGAQAKVGWKVMVPSALGKPDAVYVMPPPNGPSGGEVTLVYAQAPGVKPSAQTGVAVLVTEARGQLSEVYFQKLLGPDTTLEPVTFHGHTGFWISGHPHGFLYVAPDGQVTEGSLRLATNTLLLDVDGTLVRIEGDMTKDQALGIAGTLAGSTV